MVTSVHIVIRLIVPPGQPDQVLEIVEFDTSDWETNMRAAYEWLVKWRKPTCSYKVYC